MKYRELNLGQIEAIVNKLGGYDAALKLLRDELVVSEPAYGWRFALLTTFQFAVPENYNHPTQLTSFKKENREKFYFYNDNITDANFAKTTNRLTPGKTYEMRIFEITQRVTSEDCLALLKTQKALLVGAQGISVVWQQARGQLPKGKWIISFDEKDSLWRVAGGYHRAPSMSQDSDSDWYFDLGGFGGGWGGGCVLLCVRNLST